MQLAMSDLGKIRWRRVRVILVEVFSSQALPLRVSLQPRLEIVLVFEQHVQDECIALFLFIFCVVNGIKNGKWKWKRYEVVASIDYKTV